MKKTNIRVVTSIKQAFIKFL